MSKCMNVRICLEPALHARAKARMATLRMGWDRYVSALVQVDLADRPALTAFAIELAEERELREQERGE
jgi:hypothetical protein